MRRATGPLGKTLASRRTPHKVLFVIPSMQHVAAQHLTRARQWRRLSVVVVVAAITGTAAAIVRPRIHGTIHYESIISVFVVLPTICACLSLSLRRVPWRQSLGWLVLGEVPALCLAYDAAFVIVFRGSIGDESMIIMVWWLILGGLSAALLIGWQHWHRPTVGPYCPACSYCLIGLPIDRCPECGRDFTLEELGVTRDALREPTAEQSHNYEAK